MSRVFWDTNLFVYLFEGGPFSRRVRDLRARMIDRGDTLVTSTLTVAELLVKPLEDGEETMRDYEHALRQAATIVPFDLAAAPLYAAIRRDRTIRPPDAIQLASAAAAGVDLFIKNDDRLSRKIVPGVQFITSLDRAQL